MTSHSTPLPTREIIAQATRLLHHLNTAGHAAHVSDLAPDQVILSRRHKGLSLGNGTLSTAAADWLRQRRLMCETAPGTFELTDTGRAMAAHMPDKAVDLADPPAAVALTPKLSRRKRRSPQRKPDKAPAAENGLMTGQTIGQDNDEHHTVRINEAESPLCWLHKRRDRTGQPFIDATCFEAGERLRRDITVAGIMPRVTANWSPVRGGNSGPASATDAMIAARQRLQRALTAVDGDYAGILLDVCGFLKPIEDVERDRHWPPRSGKVVLKLALRRLAFHYGMTPEARGPDNARHIRSWQADKPMADHR